MATPELTLRAGIPVAQRRALDTPGRLLALGVAVSAFGLLAGDWLTLAGEAVAIAVVVGALIRAPRPLRSPVPFWVVAVVGLVVILLVDGMQDNYPGPYPFLLGLRKTLPIWVFLLAGAVWPVTQRAAVLRALVHVLLVAAAVSLILHLFFSSTEAAIVRAADPYTALYAGSERLQGVFAGPFHAALAGIALVVFAATGRGFAGARYRAVACAIGLTVVWQANVRSAWVALAIATVSLLLFVPARHRLGRALGVLLVCLVATTIVLLNAPALSSTHNDALASLSDWSRDSRLLNRLDEWEHARHLVAERPLTGWGAGSAGDTLGQYFEHGSHVTAHNTLVKYAVETGLVGAILVALVLAAALVILVRQPREQRLRPLAVVLLISFLTIGAATTAVDAIPVSWIVMFVVGLAINDVGGRGFGVPRAESMGAPG